MLVYHLKTMMDNNAHSAGKIMPMPNETKMSRAPLQKKIAEVLPGTVNQIKERLPGTNKSNIRSALARMLAYKVVFKTLRCDWDMQIPEEVYSLVGGQSDVERGKPEHKAEPCELSKAFFRSHYEQT